MNWKTWVPLVLAVVLGLIAMKVVRDVMAKDRTGGGEQGTPVVIIKQDLPAGSQLTAENLDTAKIAGVNPSAVFSNAADLEGRVLAADVVKGLPVVEGVLKPAGTGSGLQALLDAGYRAITMQIDEFSGVAGNLTPGCYVDIVSTINGDGGDMLARTVVQNIKVQSLGMRKQGEGEGASESIKSVTLVTTPEQAEALELAAATGRPRVVLRAANDHAAASSDGITVSELRQGGALKDPFGMQRVELIQSPSTQPVAESRQRKSTRQITIIRGGIESTTEIQEIAAPVGPKWMSDLNTSELQSQ